MYNIAEMKIDLISQIKKQITTPITNCLYYNVNTDSWGTPLNNMDKDIEALIYDEDFTYVVVHITRLEQNGVFGVYETSDYHDTDTFEYEDIDLKALFEISDYLDKLYPKTVPSSITLSN